MWGRSTQERGRNQWKRHREGRANLFLVLRHTQIRVATVDTKGFSQSLQGKRQLEE